MRAGTSLWDWGDTTKLAPLIYQGNQMSDKEKEERQKTLYEMQRAVFDSNIDSEMKIKLISFIGKSVDV